MADDVKKMRPIWFFIGLMLLLIGGLVFIAGIYYLLNPGQSSTVLQEVHPNIWWGGLMLIVGGIFLFFNRNVTVD